MYKQYCFQSVMAEKVCTQSRSLETARLRGVSATKDPKASCDRQMQKDEVDEVPNTTISSGTRPKELLGKVSYSYKF